MWKTLPIFCPLDFFSQFNTSSEQFIVYWLMDKIQNETYEAQQTVKKIRSKTSQHLSGFQGNSPHDCCETQF